MIYLLINSLKAGGAERVAQTLSSKLADEIILLEDEQDYEVALPIKKLSRHTSRTSPFLKTFFIPFYARRLGRMIKRDDVVISFIERANFVNILCKIFFKNKAIITVHTGLRKNFKNVRKCIYLILIKMLYPMADMIVPVSFGIANDLKGLIRAKEDKIRVIYNPIDIEKIDNLSKERIDSSYENIFLHKVVITAGRLVKEKSHRDLLKAFSIAIKDERDAKLVILGEGPLKSDLVSYARSLNMDVFWLPDSQDVFLPYDVYFLGYAENPYKYFKPASLFFLSSQTEGLPMVLLESMACGLPVISTDCEYGPREELSLRPFAPNSKSTEFSDFGILVPVISELSLDPSSKDALFEEWASAIKKMLNDSDAIQFYKSRIRKRAADFAMDNIIEKWREEIKSVI